MSDIASGGGAVYNNGGTVITLNGVIKRPGSSDFEYLFTGSGGGNIPSGDGIYAVCFGGVADTYSATVDFRDPVGLAGVVANNISLPSFGTLACAAEKNALCFGGCYSTSGISRNIDWRFVNGTGSNSSNTASTARYYGTAATVKDKALMVSGATTVDIATTSSVTAVTELYTDAGVRAAATSVSYGDFWISAASAGENAVVHCRNAASLTGSVSSIFYYYNNSGSRGTGTAPSSYLSRNAAASAGDNAIFIGGCGYNGSYYLQNKTYYRDSAGLGSQGSDLNINRCDLAAATAKNVAVSFGGNTATNGSDSTSVTIVEYYSSVGVRNEGTALTVKTMRQCAASAGDNAISMAGSASGGLVTYRRNDGTGGNGAALSLVKRRTGGSTVKE